MPTVCAKRLLGSAPGDNRMAAMSLARWYRLGSQLLPYVPPSLGYWLCERLSVFAPRVGAWPRILANLEHVLPDDSEATRQRYARGVVTNLLKNYFELLHVHKLPAAQLAGLVSIQGVDNLKRALAQGRGVIIALPHMGPVSVVAGPVAAMIGKPVLLLAEQMRDPELHSLLKTLRERPMIEIVEVGPRVVRTIMQALRDGRVVALASDRTVAEATVEVDFFGARARVPAGPAVLALRTGAPLLTAYAYRHLDNRSTMTFDPPLLIERGGDLDTDVQRLMQAVVHCLQAYIRRDPAQWLLTEHVWPPA